MCLASLGPGVVLSLPPLNCLLGWGAFLGAHSRWRDVRADLPHTVTSSDQCRLLLPVKSGRQTSCSFSHCRMTKDCQTSCMVLSSHWPGLALHELQGAKTPGLGRMETSRDMAGFHPRSFPHTSRRPTASWACSTALRMPRQASSLKFSCWAMRNSSLPDASKSGSEPVSWSRSGVRGDLSHALLWAGRLPPAAFQGGVVPMGSGQVSEPGTPGEEWLHGELNSLSL